MINVNLKQLEAFVTAAEHSSFTRAAQELYLTQSTVSAHISKLEQALGVKLFAREAKKKIHLTQDGQNVYLRAKDILSRCAELVNLRDTKDARLLIGASTVPAQHMLPCIMSDFLKSHSTCSYLLKRGDSAKIHEFLQNGEVRIGFVGAAPTPSAYSYHALFEDELVLVTAAAERYKALYRNSAQGRELLGEPLILREESSGTLRALREYLKRIHYAPEAMHIVARSDNPEAIKNMISAGMGVSVMSALAVKDELQAGKLLAFPMDKDGVYRKIYIAYRHDAQLSRAEKEFISFAKNEAKKAYH